MNKEGAGCGVWDGVRCALCGDPIFRSENDDRRGETEGRLL